MRAVLISAYVVMLVAIACTGAAHAKQPHGIFETISSSLSQFMNKYMTPYARSRRQVNMNGTECINGTVNMNGTVCINGTFYINGTDNMTDTVTDRCVMVGGVTFGSKCLFFSSEQKSWDDAKDTCARRHQRGQLASLTERAAEVREYVFNNYGSSFWVGASDTKNEGTWIWLNGKPVDQSLWASGEPNDAGRNEDCMQIKQYSGYNDATCTDTARYICELGGCMFEDTNYDDGATLEGVYVEERYENLTCTDGTWTNGTQSFTPWTNGTWTNERTWVNGTWENGTWIEGEWTNGTWISSNTSPSCEYKGAWYTSGTNIDEDCISRTCEFGYWHIVDYRCAYKGEWYSGGTSIDEDGIIRTCEDGNWNLTDYGCPEAEGFFRSPPEANQCLKVFRDQEPGLRQGRSWAESDSKCKSEGLVLAEPNNPVFLRKDLIERYGEDFDGYWVGARANGTHMKWVRGGGVLGNCSPLWRPGHPENRLSTGHCLELRADNYAMREYPGTQYTSWNCSWPFYTLCEKLIIE